MCTFRANKPGWEPVPRSAEQDWQLHEILKVDAVTHPPAIPAFF